MIVVIPEKMVFNVLDFFASKGNWVEVEDWLNRNTTGWKRIGEYESFPSIVVTFIAFQSEEDAMLFRLKFL